MKVWYVSYGSNICLDRFMCYINGDTPPGSDKKEKGCRDKTPPSRNEKIILSHPIYFTKERSKWGTGGVAFIGHQPLDTTSTYGRMYLITEEQFKDVVAQENNLDHTDFDLKKVMKEGHGKIDDGWYGRILYLGKKEGAPMFTFTSNKNWDETTFTTPPSSYLNTIARGLLEIGFTKQEIVDYFSQVPGIKNDLSKKQLHDYIVSNRTDD